MIELNRLKGAIKEAGYSSLSKAGQKIGMRPSTFYKKMNNGEFTIAEVDDMIEVFCIRHPEEIFIYGRKR